VPGPLDRQQLATYAAIAAFTGLVPVPLLDTWLGNRVRRTLFRKMLLTRGATVPDAELAAFADTPSGGCLGVFLTVLIWPLKKLLRTVFFVWEMKVAADAASDVFHRALLLEEALEKGWAPGELSRIRIAIDATLKQVDVRILERHLRGVPKGAVRRWGVVPEVVERFRLEMEAPVTAPRT